jgi:hypothetical protein
VAARSQVNTLGPTLPPSLAPQLQAPPARQRRPATFDDIPDDALPYILAHLPQGEGFRAALTCRACACAVRPPSPVWADLTLSEAQLARFWPGQAWPLERQPDPSRAVHSAPGFARGR